MKMLLNSFHLNGHTLGFHPQTKTFEPGKRLTRDLTLEVKGLNRTLRLLEIVVSYREGKVDLCRV